jgi:hypothetical protein
MGRPRGEFPPRPKVHQGNARVWWNGRWHHLGPAGSEAARVEHGRLVSIWAVDPYADPRSADELLVVELIRDYLASADAPRGRQAQWRTRHALKLLAVHHAETSVEEFGPVALAAWRDWLCAQTKGKGKGKTSRMNETYVRHLVGAVRKAFKWGVGSERVAVEKWQALETVGGPRPGSCRPAGKRQAVKRAAVEATLPYLRPPVRAMIRFMLLYGCRPSYLCRMTPGQVHRSGVVDVEDVGEVDLDELGVWVYVPTEHKTSYRGDPAWVAIGPPGQEVLRPFLERGDDEPCFSPRESLADLRAEQRAERERRDGGSGGDRKARVAVKEREYRNHYTADTLRQAVDNAIRRANRARARKKEPPIPHWYPYQIRHRVSNEIDATMGLDEAQAALGHKDPEMTRRYAKRSFAAAVRVAKARE